MLAPLQIGNCNRLSDPFQVGLFYDKCHNAVILLDTETFQRHHTIPANCYWSLSWKRSCLMYYNINASDAYSTLSWLEKQKIWRNRRFKTWFSCRDSVFLGKYLPLLNCLIRITIRSILRQTNIIHLFCAFRPFHPQAGMLSLNKLPTSHTGSWISGET